MADLTSKEHDHAAFRECLVLADTVRRFLAVNEKALRTLSELNVISDYQMLRNDSAAAQGARERRLVAARAEEPSAPEGSEDDWSIMFNPEETHDFPDEGEMIRGF